MNEIQYRWKIIDPQGVLKGEWMSTKQNCLHDFMQNPHVPQEERKIYLYKRVPIPAGKRYFRMIGKSKYEQFRWKVKCQWNVCFTLQKTTNLHGLLSRETGQMISKSVLKTFMRRLPKVLILWTLVCLRVPIHAETISD